MSAGEDNERVSDSIRTGAGPHEPHRDPPNDCADILRQSTSEPSHESYLAFARERLKPLTPGADVDYQTSAEEAGERAGEAMSIVGPAELHRNSKDQPVGVPVDSLIDMSNPRAEGDIFELPDFVGSGTVLVQHINSPVPDLLELAHSGRPNSGSSATPISEPHHSSFPGFELCQDEDDTFRKGVPHPLPLQARGGEPKEENLEAKLGELRDQLGSTRKHLHRIRADLNAAEIRSKALVLALQEHEKANYALRQQVSQLEIQCGYSSRPNGNINVPQSLVRICEDFDDVTDLITRGKAGKRLNKLLPHAGRIGPEVLRPLVAMARGANAELSGFVEYAIALLLLHYVRDEIWAPFHPAASLNSKTGAQIRNYAISLGEIYSHMITTESHIKFSNWRLYSARALWGMLFRTSSSVPMGISAIAQSHAHYFFNHVLQPLAMDLSVDLLQAAPIKEALSSIFARALELKYHSQTIDARSEYEIEIPDVLYSGDLEFDTPIACRLPKLVRYEASRNGDKRMAEVQQLAAYSTAGEAGWATQKEWGFEQTLRGQSMRTPYTPVRNAKIQDLRNIPQAVGSSEVAKTKSFITGFTKYSL